jgi:hypothetical protein
MNLSKILHIALLWSTVCTARAQTCSWASGLGSTNTTTRMEQVRSYAAEHVVVCGAFAAPALVLGTQTLSNSGQEDGFVAIADADGSYLWATRFGGSNNEVVTDVAANSSGDIIAVGNFRSLFLPVGTTTLSNTGESDVFVAKYNADHSLAWAHAIGGSEIEEATAVRVDATGAILVSGQRINKFTLQTIHLFVRKYSPDGNLLWERTGNLESGAANASALAVDAQQNVYISGWMYGTMTFANTTLVGDQGYAAFVVKHDADGNLVDTFISYDQSDFTGMAIQDDNVYLCGRKVNFGIGWGWPLGDSKVYVLKLDEELNTIWSRDFGGVTPNFSLDRAESIDVDAQGNAYVTGSFFSDSLFFADDTLINPYNAPYYYPQVFTAKYTADGQEAWALAAGGIHTDEATSIAVMNEDQFYLVGNFESDPSIFGTHTLSNQSQLDSIYVHLLPARYGRRSMGFMARFDGDNTTGIEDRPTPGYTVWPNPAEGILRVRLDPNDGSPVQVEVTTLDGRCVMRNTSMASLSEVQVDVSGLAPSPYILTIRSATSTQTQRFIKQ